MSGYYPAFLDVKGRRCVVIGAGEVAQRKVGTLLEAGARVTVFSPDGTEELARRAKAGEIAWRRRGYRPGDLRGAWLAIAATDDSSVNEAIAREAEERGVLLNVVDRAELCSFIAPSLVQRGDLTIAVSTGGKSPAVARKVREELELLFPLEYGTLLEVAAEVRETLLARGARAPADLWQRALSNEVMTLVREGRREQAKEALLRLLRQAAPVGGQG